MQAVYEKKNEDIYCRDCVRHSTNTLGFHSHLHHQIELAVVFEGHTRATIDSTPYEVMGGDIIVVFPNQIHDFRTLQKEQYILLKVAPDFIPELSSPFTGQLPASNLLKGAASDPDLYELIHRISEVYYGAEPYRDGILRGYLLAFFGKLLQKMELRDVQAMDYHVVGAIMNYCSQNFDKDLSLELLEKELHLSRYYISHVMSNKLHIGFCDYVNSLRVARACNYLIKGELTVTEISEAVGFNTLRTFNRAFIKQMGISPSEYRKKKKKEPSARKKQ